MNKLELDALACANASFAKIYTVIAINGVPVDEPNDITLHIATMKGCGVKSRHIKFQSEKEANDYWHKLVEYNEKKNRRIVWRFYK